MKNLGYREYYRRKLPHIQPRGATFLVSFRLAGSMPNEVIKRLQIEREQLNTKLSQVIDPEERRRMQRQEDYNLFYKSDDALHKSSPGPFYLQDAKVAGIVANTIQFHNGDWFDLAAYCIMPNHVHLVLRPFRKTESDDYGLAQIMHNIKRNSAKQANLVLNRTARSGSMKVTTISSAMKPNSIASSNMCFTIRLEPVW